MAQPVPLRMNDATALRVLREIAQDSAQVIFTRHARQRMRQRKVSPVQVLTCLQRGIASEPVALDVHGNWKLTVTHRVSGKDLDVAVAIDVPKRAIVITVF
jgi:hypothetical protein